MLDEIRRLLTAAAVAAMAAAPVSAQASLADKASDAPGLRERAHAGGAAVIVEIAAPGLAPIAREPAVDARAADAAREKVVAATLDGFVGRFFAGRNDRAAVSKRFLKKMRYAPLVAFVATPEELERLAADPSVVRIHPDRANELKLTQAVPLVGMAAAWKDGARGGDTVVAVLDTGVQASHPFLGDRVVMQACFSTGGTDGGTRYIGLCPNHEPLQIGGDAGQNCPLTYAGCSHGTHVAGIIAGDNPRPGGRPPAGVAPKADIVAIQVASVNVARNGINIQDRDYISALEFLYSVRNRISGGKPLAAVNMSFGGNPEWTKPCEEHPARPIIQLLRNAGVASVIATGNEYRTAKMGEPACVPEAVKVGSTTKADLISNFSNAAPFMDLFAPGSDILSSMPVNEYRLDSGTSMATPMVAGAFAALRSAVPEAGVGDILDALVATGKPIRDSRYGGVVTKPRIQVDKALKELQARDGNLVASPRQPVVLPPGRDKPASFAVTLSARSGSEKWRLLAVPDWIVAPQRQGTVGESGRKISFRAKPLGAAQLERTGWLVFASRSGARSRFVRIEQRRTQPLLVVDVKGMHPLRVTVRNGVATPAQFTVDVTATTGEVPFALRYLPPWLKASTTSGRATTTKRTISFRIVPPARLDATVSGGGLFVQTDIDFEAMDFGVELSPAGPARANETAAVTAAE